jgi:hypothetical protein
MGVLAGQIMGISGPLSDNELGRLKELVAAGPRGLIKTDRRGFTRIVKRRYVQERPAGVDEFLYAITDRGRRLLAEAPNMAKPLDGGECPHG